MADYDEDYSGSDSSSDDDNSSSYSSSDLDEDELAVMGIAAAAGGDRTAAAAAAAGGGDGVSSKNQRYFPSVASLASVSSLEDSFGSSDYSSDESGSSGSDDSDYDDDDEGFDPGFVMPRAPPGRPALPAMPPMGFGGGGGGGMRGAPGGLGGLAAMLGGGGGGGGAPEGLPFGGEGLPFTLESLKKDLQAVGRAIITSNSGAVAAERANVLQSINWLASHVPNAVLEELGQEIRESLEKEKQNENAPPKESIAQVVEEVERADDDDDMSEISELSAVLAFEKDKTMAMVEPTEVSNVGVSYGDLATFALNSTNKEGQNAQSPDLPDIDEFQPDLSPKIESAKDGQNANAAASRSSIIDKLPSSPLKGTKQRGILGSLPTRADEKTGGPSDPFSGNYDKSNLAGIADSFVSPKNKRSTLPAEGSKGMLHILKDKDGLSKELNVGISRGSSDGTATPTISPDASSSSSGDSSTSDGNGRSTDESATAGRPIRGCLPFSHDVRCALLFIDISGFTKLSTLLDPESLSKAINAYFQLIVDNVLESKGDILKFAGDACFVQYEATDKCDLEGCLLSALNGAKKIIDASKDFLVMGNGATSECSYLLTSTATKVETLNVHCGIGAGQMVGVHVGDTKLRREYVLLGEPISQATDATDFAKLGEVAISAEAYSILSNICDFTEEAQSDGKTPTVVATREAAYYSVNAAGGAHLQPKIVNDISRGVTHVDGLDVDALREYRSRMSLYCHPVVVDNDQSFKGAKVKKADRSAAERHREEAEIRQVFTMFVCPRVECKLSKDPKKNRALYHTLNDIMNLSSRFIDKYTGHLRQFIVDDKGLVLIITFGLRGTTIPNMVSKRAVPAALAIHSALQMELGIDSNIGCTVGEAYCGVVGGVKRHEYAVLGPSVNLAARLMSSKTNPGVLVDNRVRMMSNRSFGFNALEPVKAKGYSEPVPIFEPLGAIERKWGRILPNFAGRKAEILNVMKITVDMLRSRSPSRMIMIESKNGVGKTAMVAHAIEHIKRRIGKDNKRLIVLKNASTETDALVPFGIFRNVLQKILIAYQKSSAENDDKSLVTSHSSVNDNGPSSIAWESLSGRSISQSTQALSCDCSASLFQRICQELNMPPLFVDYALRELLGVELTDEVSKPAKPTPPAPEEMIEFLRKAFLLCTREKKLAIVALDDIHLADEYSWKVIQKLFLTDSNILFIGTMDSQSSDRMNIDEEFWKDLNSKFKSQERFVPIKVGVLNRDEIASMAMKSLGLLRKNIPEDFLDGLAIQSGGMPYFVSDVLEMVKKQMASVDDFELSDAAFDSFGDLILQRLDSFDQCTRNVLNIGSVIGLSFTLDDVVRVEMKMSDGTEAAIRKATEESLKVAVEEGIIESRDVCDDEDDLEEVRKYAFCHALWRITLLNLMLLGRKRDLHRVIAETMEELDVDTGDYMFQAKVFKHWVNSGNFVKATEVGLTVGKHFEQRLGLPAQSIRIYNETLDLLRVSEEGVTKGISADVLARIDATDLTYLVQLHVALGEALSMAQLPKESVSCYQDALRIAQTARSASHLKDRSILFPVFAGLSTALKNGHIAQDAECRYEKAMLRRYMQETRLHGDPIFIIHALTLQADMHSRLGDFETAINMEESLKSMYNVEYFSLDLTDNYGTDIGAQCIATSALWRLSIDKADEALATCRYVTTEILPFLEQRNVHVSFMVLYPVMWVLVECGFALEARSAFEQFICEPFMDLPQGTTTFFMRLYDPILMILRLSEDDEISPTMIQDYVEWALDEENLRHGAALNKKTTFMGRSADSFSVEICCHLAVRVEDEETKNKLIELGLSVAEEDVKFVTERGGELALNCSEGWLANLNAIASGELGG